MTLAPQTYRSKTPPWMRVLAVSVLALVTAGLVTALFHFAPTEESDTVVIQTSRGPIHVPPPKPKKLHLN